jgi:spore maturation protein CgeB
MNDPFGKYRKDFRSWKKGIRLRREWNMYERKFDSLNCSIPDEKDIQEAIRARFPNLTSKQKGDLRIVAIYRHYNWENGSLKASLKKFGSVLQYDWSERYSHDGAEGDRSVREEMNDDLIATLKQWTNNYSIDVIFTYLSGENVTPATVRKMNVMGIPMVNMFLNDKEGFVGKIHKGQSMGSRDICRYFDLCWTSTEDAVKKYCVEGALPIYLPEGANPDLHRPFDIEKTVDVSFVGQCYGNRPEIIERLERQGIHVEAYGYGWPNGPLTMDEMIRMYSKSKINLGFGGVGSLRNTCCLKGRDFEVPMSGGLYLTEYHPELARWYDLGREIVTYGDLDDLAQKIRHLLSNPEEAEEIRKRGFRRARSEHSWEIRFEKIFRLMGLLL